MRCARSSISRRRFPTSIAAASASSAPASAAASRRWRRCTARDRTPWLCHSPGDERSGVGGQEADGCGHFLRLAISAERNDLGEGSDHLGGGACRHRILHRAWRNAVDSGFVASRLEGSRSCEANWRQIGVLAIARAPLTNPRILILDEATSALGYESEAIIQGNMAQICRRPYGFHHCAQTECRKACQPHHHDGEWQHCRKCTKFW